jgi:hypothetical protein
MNQILKKILDRLLIFFKLKKPVKKEVKRLIYNKSQGSYEIKREY